MSTLRKAAQQALEALEKYRKMMFVEAGCRFGEGDAAITDLRAALAEPVQGPAAWRYKKEGGGWFVSDNEPQYVEQWNDIEEIQPLYTAPPQRKPLTEEELDALAIDEDGLPNSHIEFARAIERAHGIT